MSTENIHEKGAEAGADHKQAEPVQEEMISVSKSQIEAWAQTIKTLQERNKTAEADLMEMVDACMRVGILFKPANPEHGFNAFAMGAKLVRIFSSEARRQETFGAFDKMIDKYASKWEQQQKKT